MLPAVIGFASFESRSAFFLASLAFFTLAALIRLAFFNVTEEERQKTEGGVRKYYTGLPVTTASLIFPLVMLAQYVTAADISLFYIAVALLTAVAFVSKMQVPKPGLNGILGMMAVGVILLIVMVVITALSSSPLSFLNIFISH